MHANVQQICTSQLLTHSCMTNSLVYRTGSPTQKLEDRSPVAMHGSRACGLEAADV